LATGSESQLGKSGHGRPLAGLGIGLITGVGSLFYCFALDYLSVAMVVTFSNLYIVITTLLGIVVLGERVTALKIAGLATVNGLGTRCRGVAERKVPLATRRRLALTRPPNSSSHTQQAGATHYDNSMPPSTTMSAPVM
jgi:EamA-like transporter family